MKRSTAFQMSQSTKMGIFAGTFPGFWRRSKLLSRNAAARNLWLLKLGAWTMVYWTENLLFMPDLFVWALCAAAGTEKTIASTSQMFNPMIKNWHENVVSHTGFPCSLLPEVGDCASVCGAYQGMKVIRVAGHDTQCAIAAMPSDGSQEAAFLSCGTWSLIGCELDDPILTEKSMADELSNELGANGKVDYLKNISGLWLIQELRRNFRTEGKEYTYNDMEQLARKAEPYACFIDPDAPEFASPGDMQGKIRAFCRRTCQRIPETDGSLVRCVYESLAMKYRYAIVQIQENTGKCFQVLHLLGGGTKDGFLCQMTADALEIPVVAGPVEATALGNILLQLVALGDIPDLETGRKIIRSQELLTTYMPRPQPELEAAYIHFLRVISYM